MVEIRMDYRGQLRCEAVHGPSGEVLLTDAPKDNMGKGEAFSPTDLVATALGTCMLTILGIAAQKSGLDLAGARATVLKEMASAPARRIGRLTVDIHVPLKLSREDQERLEGAARLCPVAKSLHPDVELLARFHWA